jgi:SAM-dependent methyltransferase
MARKQPNNTLSGERPEEGATPDSLLALHAAGYRAVVERLGLGRVLDAGCGNGFESATMLAPERVVIGADYSLSATQSARQRFGPAGLGVAQMDALAFGFVDASFDFVVSSHLIEHFSAPDRHVEELARLSGSEGTAFVITPNAPADFENPFHLHLFTATELMEALQRSFHEVTLYGIDAVAHVKADFAARRAKANKVLALDVFDLRHKIPHRWYVAAYTRLLPIAYRLMASGDVGGSSGITVEDWFVTDDVDDETLVLLAVAHRPRRPGQPA